MSLEQVISTVRDNLQKGIFLNEAAVSNGAVLPILNQLGWDVFNPAVVVPQFKIETHFKREKRFVDFALIRPNGNPCIFLEAKRVGGAAQGEVQLFEYAFHKGVPFVVLTDGQEWSFYFPAGEGDYQDRRVYKLDLLERNLTECSYRLNRYLTYADVASGAAFDCAQTDYKDANRAREIEKFIPQAWGALLAEADDLLVEILADKVEDLCGFKPELETCGVFLSSIAKNTNQSKSPPTPSPSSSNDKLNSQSTSYHVPSSSKFVYTLLGQHYTFSNGAELMTSVFEKLVERDSTFPERFAARKHGKKRRYLAQNKLELYPDRPDLCEAASRKLTCGYYISTNWGNTAKEKIIQLACEVADLKFGSDLLVTLG